MAANTPSAPGPDHPGQHSNGPTIRHIPIHVEGRDEPIINKTFPETTNPSVPPGVRATGSGSSLYSNHPPYQQQQPQANNSNIPRGTSPQPPQSSNSIFSRVKNFPVRSGFDNEFFQGHGSNFSQRANSPGRSIPVNVSHETGRSASPAGPQIHRPYSNAAAAAAANAATARAAAAAAQQQQYQSNSPATNNHDARPTSTEQGRYVTDDSIEKIQKIQHDVLMLMDQVEQFRGTSKRDKQYLYLDEMLTQNLLKLDTIDTEGKENIKQARREAIKCINKCISVLEAKTDAANSGGGQ